MRGATKYYDPIGGQGLYPFEDLREKGIGLRFLKTGKIVYHQRGNEFCRDLSIIDVMMFNSQEQVKNLGFIYIDLWMNLIRGRMINGI